MIDLAAFVTEYRHFEFDLLAARSSRPCLSPACYSSSDVRVKVCPDH